MASITFDHATRRYPGATHPAVDALSLDTADGEFLVLVGPSGCGKSTSLRMLAGLEEVNGGAIRIGDRDVTHIPPKDRDIAMVFQNYALYPHMSVADNMGFALKIAGMDKREIRRRVEEAATILDLTDYLARKPKALSGGQRQRVAMGRAIVRQPQCFLMDEPLSNLDAKLRVQTRTQIASLQRRLGTTTVYVTHDQVEAMTMGDRVAVLCDGVLQQFAAPKWTRSPSRVVCTRFMAGEPMKPATNRLLGLSYMCRGESHCCRMPSLSTATRSPMVMASTWSCVTYTVVVPSRRCSEAIWVRVCTRSLASKLDSGSSMQNTWGWRTMARPMATRWRWPPESAFGLRSR